jgi:hypothetical protein
MQMGYTTNFCDLSALRSSITKEERKETKEEMKEVRESLKGEGYCDWSKPISTEAVVLFERVR